jgi:hypothetical protein
VNDQCKVKFHFLLSVITKSDVLLKHPCILHSGVPRKFVRGVQQIQLRTEDRENGDLEGGSSLVRGSGGSCKLVKEISFHIVKFS